MGADLSLAVNNAEEADSTSRWVKRTFEQEKDSGKEL